MVQILIKSLLFGVLFLYICFCLLLGAPIISCSSVKSLPKGIKHRWFWVISIHVGNLITYSFILAVIIGIGYVFALFFNMKNILGVM